MTRLPATVILAAVMLLGLVAGGPAHTARPAHAAPPDEAESEDTGLYLLREAAVAARSRGYSGIRYVTVQGRTGPVTSTAEVRNLPGRGLTVRTEPSGPVQGADPGAPAGGMLAPSGAMLEVLARNYRVVAAGRGQACGRPARLAEVLRPDGTVAARYWVDEAGGPVLRREFLDGRGRVVQDSGFAELTVDPVAGDVAVPVRAAGGAALVEVSGLAAEGWSFPRMLPGRLELFAAHKALPGYLYLGYSDGLSVVSVFIQHGALDEERLRGWHAERRNGHTIWTRDPAGQETIWASGGHVYTVFADAPADVADAAVAALPHEPVPDLWTRLGRGAHRLLSWFNPFG
ncbi:hypothetical protein GCM10010517_54130 [Streptosporangium fragile]|uniref:MucB/RseB N-terminal domain-containing protein n=1 Tax=Streptosporangium fragile TaxID=46186 RepID=A0ABN3W4I6_9ACTN